MIKPNLSIKNYLPTLSGLDTVPSIAALGIERGVKHTNNKWSEIHLHGLDSACPKLVLHLFWHVDLTKLQFVSKYALLLKYANVEWMWITSIAQELHTEFTFKVHN